MKNWNRVDYIIEELVSLEEALQTTDYHRAYCIYRDLMGDMFAADLSTKDVSSAVDIFCEVTHGYEIDDDHQVFIKKIKVDRVDYIIEELIALNEALRTPDCHTAYAVWLDFHGDINAKDVNNKDRTVAIELFNEISKCYEIDTYRKAFVLAF